MSAITGQGGKTSASRVVLLGTFGIVLAAWLTVGVGMGVGWWAWETWAGWMQVGTWAAGFASGAFGANELGGGIGARGYTSYSRSNVEQVP